MRPPTTHGDDRVSALWRWFNRIRGHATALQPEEIDSFETFGGALIATRPRGYADYLFQRFANPSFLAAIPAVIVLGQHCSQSPRARMLEILCGTGHLSAVVTSLCPEVTIIVSDIDFANLMITSRFLVPGTPAICIDVELPLPFADDTFDGLFCVDGLHYVRSKRALLSEVDRVVSKEGGAWVFAHVHNAAGENVSAGSPLDSDGYRKRFAFGEQRLLPEAGILDQVKRDGSLDLTASPENEEVAKSNALTLVGARGGELWRRHERLDEAMTRRHDLIALNPIYRAEKDGNGFMASAQWPSEALHTECTASGQWIPETVSFDGELVEEIVAARKTGFLSERVRHLVLSFVLVCLPACYERFDAFL